MIRWLYGLVGGSLVWTNYLDNLFEPSSPTSSLISKSTARWIKDIGKQYDFPGIGIGLVASPKRMGGTDWHTEVLSLGHSNDTGDHFTMDTMFNLASNSKLFTAISIGLLIENGTMLNDGSLLDYDTKVEDILKHWSMVDPYMQHHLDLVDLLAMRTGIPSHHGSHVQGSTKEMVKRFNHLRPSAETRQRMQYNDYHYWVLAEIIAKLSGMTVIDYAQKHILDPLNMTSTTWNHTEAAETGHIPRGYQREGRDLKHCREIHRQKGRFDISCHGRSTEIEWFIEGDGLFHAGPAGMTASFRDMLAWLRELLSPQILPPDRVAITHQSLIPAFDRVTRYDEVSVLSYGHAQMTLNYRGHEVIFHIGTLPGAASLVVRLPALEIGLFVTATELILGAVFNLVILYRILDDLLQLDPIDWEYRLYTSTLLDKDDATEPPEAPRPGLSRESIEGLYYDEAYGYLNITRVDDIDSASITFDPSFTSHMQSLRRAQVASTESSYFASMPNIYFSGLWLDHFDGPLYNATALGTRQKVNGAVLPFSTGTYTAVIVEHEGVGLFDNIWAGLDDKGNVPPFEKGKTPVEEGVAREAEVWFRKLPAGSLDGTDSPDRGRAHHREQSRLLKHV